MELNVYVYGTFQCMETLLSAMTAILLMADCIILGVIWNGVRRAANRLLVVGASGKVTRKKKMRRLYSNVNCYLNPRDAFICGVPILDGEDYLWYGV